jgi:putative chitinase
MTPQQFIAIMPRAPQLWSGLLSDAMAEFGIDNWVRQAAFLANVAHESRECTRLVEDLTYRSAEGVRKTYGARIPSLAEAEGFVRQPEKLANFVYANRYGNGNSASGDGWRYRGRGLIQITFKDNYYACGKALGLSLVSEPELLEIPAQAARSAGWYWYSRGLNAVATAGGEANFERIVRAINGGLNGFDDRRAKWLKAMEVLR